MAKQKHLCSIFHSCDETIKHIFLECICVKQLWNLTRLCSFCHSYDETIQHIFLECICVRQLWSHLRLFLTNNNSLPILTPQTVIFGFVNRIENNVYKRQITNFQSLNYTSAKVEKEVLSNYVG